MKVLGDKNKFKTERSFNISFIHVNSIILNIFVKRGF